MNLLGEGDPRLGMLVDMLDTPETAVMLRRDGHGLILSIPLVGDSKFRSWFSKADQVPESLWFVGPRDRLALVGCHHLLALPAWNTAVGEGQVSVSMAVHDARTGEDYSSINGMQSVVPGLGLWLGTRSMPIERSPDGGRLESLSLRWTRDPAIAVGRRLNIEIQRGFSFRDRVPGDQAILEDEFSIQTLVARPRPWRDHLTLHMAVRDLVGLAAWRSFELSSMWVMRTSDPLTTRDGRSHGAEWLPAQEFILQGDDRGHASRPNFVFEYRDLPPSFLDRWLLLRDRHVRPIQIMVTSLRQRRVPVEAQVLHVGAAFDALGYELAREQTSRTNADNEAFEDRVRRVVAELPPNPSRLDPWVDAFRVAYRGAKHGDKSLPEAQVAMDVVASAQLVFQLWVAGSLGVSDDGLTEHWWRVAEFPS